MMGTIEVQGLSAVVGASLMAISSSLDKVCRRMSARTAELERATEALKAHYDALECFVDDPASPDRLCELLLSFSDAVVDEQVACAALRRMCDEGPRANKSSSFDEIKRAVDSLRYSRQDLADIFDRAVGSGIVAMFLQWDSTSDLFESAARSFTANPSSELVIATKVSKASQGRHDTDPRRTPELSSAA